MFKPSKSNIVDVCCTAKSLALDYKRRKFNQHEMVNLQRRMYILLSISTTVIFIIEGVQRAIFTIYRDYDDPMGIISSKCVHKNGEEVQKGEVDQY